MRIFEWVPRRQSVKRQWDDQKGRFSVISERQRERVYFTITNTQIIHNNKNKAKGGLPEEAKAHRAGHPLLRHQQTNKNKWG